MILQQSYHFPVGVCIGFLLICFYIKMPYIYHDLPSTLLFDLVPASLCLQNTWKSPSVTAGCHGVFSVVKGKSFNHKLIMFAFQRYVSMCGYINQDSRLHPYITCWFFHTIIDDIDQCYSPLESVNSPTVWYLSFFGCLERVRHYTDMDERRNLVYFTAWSSWLLSPMQSCVMIGNWQQTNTDVKEGTAHCWVWVGCRRSGRGKRHTCHMLATFGAHPNRWSAPTSPNTHYPACYSTEHGNTIIIIYIFFCSR